MRAREALVVAALLGTACLAVLARSVSSAPVAASPPVEGDDAAEASRGATGVAGALGSLGVPFAREGHTSSRDVPDEAAEVLRERGEQGDCLVVRSGYLDLFGGVWGCVLQGGDWAEVCLVVEGAGGGGCSVARWRMSVDDVAGAFGS